jgi:FkbM family methyltransferase
MEQSLIEQHWTYTKNEWSNENYFQIVLSILKQNNIKTLIDLGANSGAVTDVLLENISSIEKCYLFEPHKENYKFLFEKFKNSDKVISLNVGIFYGKKYLNYYKLKSPHVGAFTLVGNDDNYVQTNEEFELFELEFFNFGDVDFLKMDIEGAEYNIIENSSFLQTIKFIEMEVHKEYDHNYFVKHFPNHSILFTGMYEDENKVQKINHIFLSKNI